MFEKKEENVAEKKKTNKEKKQNYCLYFERKLLKEMNYNNMIIYCIEENPTNELYKYMGG